MTTRTSDEVDAFLSGSELSPSGARCLMCTHPRRLAIEEASVRFNDQRGLWGQMEMSKKGETVLLGTNMGWNRFAMEYLKTTYGYNAADDRALRRHMEKHLGIKIA